MLSDIHRGRFCEPPMMLMLIRNALVLHCVKIKISSRIGPSLIRMLQRRSNLPFHFLSYDCPSHRPVSRCASLITSITTRTPSDRLSRKSLAAAAQFSKPIFTVTDQLIPLAVSHALLPSFSPLLMQFTSETASAQLCG